MACRLGNVRTHQADVRRERADTASVAGTEKIRQRTYMSPSMPIWCPICWKTLDECDCEKYSTYVTDTAGDELPAADPEITYTDTTVEN